MEDKRQELLDTIKQLKKETRKPRADKGMQRGPNSKTRSDAGIPRSPSSAPRSPLTVYFIVRSRLFRSAKDEDYNVYQDQDGYYIPRPGPVKQVYKNYIVNNHGLRIPRTVKNVQGKDIDLEKYRYIAFQYMAFQNPLDAPSPSQAQQLYVEFRTTLATNWLELFTRWYHLEEEQVAITSYEQWRDIHYGTPDEQDKLNQILLSKKYEDTRAHIRDEEYSKVFEVLRIETINNPQNAHLTMLQIEKVGRQRMKDEGYLEDINDRVEHRMEKWLEQQREKK